MPSKCTEPPVILQPSRHSPWPTGRGSTCLPRLADQPQHFAALQGQVDALDQRMPGVFVVTFDVQVADFQQGLQVVMFSIP
jgi:hypothetical protein